MHGLAIVSEGGAIDGRGRLRDISSFDEGGVQTNQGVRGKGVLEAAATCLWRIDTVAMKRSDPRNALQPRTQTPDGFIPGFCRG